MLNKIRQFMYGRYGYDQLGRFLFLLSIAFWVLSLIFRFTPFRRIYFVFWLLNTVIYIFAFYRIFSKNTYKRTIENERYLQFRQRLYPKWESFSKKRLDKNYIYKNCPNCNTKLRLKRVRGKHTTKCPRCGTKFNVRVIWG